MYIDQYDIEEYYWMWGLYYSNIPGLGTDILFILVEEPAQFMIPIFLSGIIPALLILVGSSKLLHMANSFRVGNEDRKKLDNKMIQWGITFIIASIIYIIAIDITLTSYTEYLLRNLGYYGIIIPDIWDVYKPGFGIIAPFIGAVIVIIGGIASKYYTSREVINIPEEKKNFTNKISTKPTTVQFRYCPECGQKLLYAKSRFCAQCGFEFIT